MAIILEGICEKCLKEECGDCEGIRDIDNGLLRPAKAKCVCKHEKWRKDIDSMNEAFKNAKK